MVSLTSGVPFLPPTPQQKTGCVVSVLTIMVLEVSTAQMPSLRLLHLCPHPYSDSNQYLQGLRLLPSLREDPAFLVPPGRQRRSAQGRARSGAIALCSGKLGKTLCACKGSSEPFHSGSRVILGVVLGLPGVWESYPPGSSHCIILAGFGSRAAFLITAPQG